MLSNIGWTTLAQIFSLIVVSTITYFISTVTRKSALAIIITFVMLFGGAAISDLFIKYDFYKYILMPNLQLNAYFPGGWTPFEGATLPFSFGVCLTYAVIFFVAGMFVFNKRDIY